MIAGAILFHAFIGLFSDENYFDSTFLIVLFLFPIIVSLFGFMLSIAGLIEKDDKK